MKHSTGLDSEMDMDRQSHMGYALSGGAINTVPSESKLVNYMNCAAPVFNSTPKVGGTPVKGKSYHGGSAPASPNIFQEFSGSRHSLVLDGPSATTLRCLSRRQCDEVDRTPITLNGSIDITNMPVATYQENVGGTTYFYPAGEEAVAAAVAAEVASLPFQSPTPSVEYNMYTSAAPSHVSNVLKEDSFFVSRDLHMEVMNRNMLTIMQTNQFSEMDLPQVDNYHELCPLEPIAPNNILHKSHLGYQTSMYKAVNMKSGITYCLRRIHGFRLQQGAKCMMTVDSWKNLRHCNIVRLQEMFTTKVFGDNSLIFVYDYHSGSETMLSKFFTSDQPDPFTPDSSPRPYSHQKTTLLRHQQINKLPEGLIWNYIIQLTAALRDIHSAGLACRHLDPSKIIFTSKNRLKLSCVGIMDVVQNESNNTTMNATSLIQHYQQEDLVALGKLVVALACKSTVAVQREHIGTALDIITRSHTNDLRNLIMYLLSSQQCKDILNLMPMIGVRFYTQLEHLHTYTDVLEHEMAQEAESSRLFRLLVKLGAINERPEQDMDSGWAETGDRYMLKLFRDYVFHQVTEDGQPLLEMSHILHCLNKFDAGSPDKICLMSRDDQSLLMVTYAELKHCFEQSYSELQMALSSVNNVIDSPLNVDDCAVVDDMSLTPGTSTLALNKINSVTSSGDHAVYKHRSRHPLMVASSPPMHTHELFTDDIRLIDEKLMHTTLSSVSSGIDCSPIKSMP